jgi:membrane protease YdiL (CAAX protease family)
MIEKGRLTNYRIAVYITVFFAIWSVRELVVQPIFLTPLSVTASVIIGGIIKLSVWTLPAVLLIRYYHENMWIGLKEMFVTKPKWFKGALVLPLVMLYPLASALILTGEIAIRPDFMPIRLIAVVILVGITEEIVFRGFLLNAFLKRMKTWQAIALDAVLFYLIHIPVWLYQGNDLVFFLTAFPTVLVLSVLFSYSFIKTRNILVPIILHMLWNLFNHILYFG